MFTGLVQATSKIVKASREVLVVADPEAWPCDGWQKGESIAVDGCCLTLVDWSGGLKFELSEETLARTTLGRASIGDRVNLERAMKASDRFGGHIVQGHVDTVGTCIGIEPLDQSVTYRFEAGSEADSLLIDKGSITVDGISLTVIDPADGAFETAIIPHTLAQTSLGDLKVGSRVNLEFDVLAKHVAKLTSNLR
jgi:riboflavin synthase